LEAADRQKKKKKKKARGKARTKRDPQRWDLLRPEYRLVSLGPVSFECRLAGGKKNKGGGAPSRWDAPRARKAKRKAPESLEEVGT